MKLPSKELMSQAIGLEVTYLSDELDGVMLPYQVARKEGWNTINIYELMHLMKVWARGKDFLIYSVPDLAIVKTFNLNHCADFGVGLEIENVFTACEWILEQKYP